jgi:hypothetical protein
LKYLLESEREANTQYWITNPFYTTASNSFDLLLKLKENLLEMSVDVSLEIKFENMYIDFWIAAR